jgi:hypothetical protein
MVRHIRRWALPLATAALVATGTSAHAALPVPTPVGPGQEFVGLVNGLIGTSNVVVTCTDGQFGHPSPGQTLAVRQVFALTGQGVGFTGNSAASIEVGPGDPRTLPVQLRVYNQAEALPTTLTLPCSGTGLFIFTPAPGSPTAVSPAVKVTFVGAA